MTFTIQEVPERDLTAEGLQMYDFTLNDILAEQVDHCMSIGLMGHEEIKIEDPFNNNNIINNLPTKYQASSSSMLASPSMNMPVLCESYNPYMQSPQNVRSLASPPNTYAHSPGDSNYSASPIESPQEDFMRYVARQPQPFSSAHVVSQSNDYGFYYNDCMAKRRQRDNELTADEYEKRRLRRERNKQAALRCRNRRRERIEALEQETSEIEAQNENVQTEITKLQSQIEELKDILKGHNCQKNICGGGLPSPPTQQQQQQQKQQDQQPSTTSEQVKVKPEPE